MRAFRHIIHQTSVFGFKKSITLPVIGMVFFWSFYDSILSFIMPLLITQNGFSKTEMGFIIGSSSIAGAVFDILLSKLLTRPHYRRLYLMVFILSFVFIGLLYSAKLFWLYIIAMAVWGMYWDLYHFANVNLVSRTVPKQQNSAAFGLLAVFHSLGNLAAPIAAGFVIGAVITATPFMLSGVMLGISFIFYLRLVLINKKENSNDQPPLGLPSTNWLQELRLLKQVGSQLMPILLLIFLIFVTDAFFWTLMPLIGESGTFGHYGGLLLGAYVLPIIITGLCIGPLTKKFGKKKTALYSFLIGSVLISTLPYTQNPSLFIATIFSASIFFAITLPAIHGANSDYIAETAPREKEIQGLADLFYNLGWTVGPIGAGILADLVGNVHSFTFLGITCAVITLVLIKVTPKEINIKL